MSISQISPSSLTNSSPYVNPYAKTTEQSPASIQQGNQEGQQAAKLAKTDTVTISSQALRMAGNGDNKTEETKENKENKPENRSGSVEVRA